MDKTRIQTKTKKRRLKKKISKRRVVEARDNANTTSADLRHMSSSSPDASHVLKSSLNY